MEVILFVEVALVDDMGSDEVHGERAEDLGGRNLLRNMRFSEKRKDSIAEIQIKLSGLAGLSLIWR